MLIYFELKNTFKPTVMDAPQTSAKDEGNCFCWYLTLFYGFIYVIIQLQALFGNIGLFITVAAMMYLSAK